MQNYAKALRKGGKAAIWGRKTQCFQIERPRFTCVCSQPSEGERREKAGPGDLQVRVKELSLEKKW